MRQIFQNIDKRLSSQSIEEILDKKIVRILAAILVVIPVSILTAIYMGFMLYSFSTVFSGLLEDLRFFNIAMTLLVLIFWVIVPTMGALGVAGAWMRILSRNSELTKELRRKAKSFIAYGIFCSIFYTVIFFLAIALSVGSLLEALLPIALFLIPGSFGLLLVSGTPSIEDVNIVKEEK